MAKPRNWRAVAAWFRRGGPMKHKTAPRGGSGSDPEITEGLEEYQTEKARQATDALFQATPEELGKASIDQSRKESQEEEEENRD